MIKNTWNLKEIVRKSGAKQAYLFANETMELFSNTKKSPIELIEEFQVSKKNCNVLFPPPPELTKETLEYYKIWVESFCDTIDKLILHAQKTLDLLNNIFK